MGERTCPDCGASARLVALAVEMHLDDGVGAEAVRYDCNNGHSAFVLPTLLIDTTATLPAGGARS